ncbi:15544_t:CDS:2, partial [Acaulospora morrowiae]
MPIRTKDKEILLNFSYKLETEIKNSGNINYMVGKAILTPKNNEVEKISDLIINRLPSEVYTYYSANSVGLEN